MFFVIREVLGWTLLLIAFGLLWFGLRVVTNANEPQIIEGGVIVFAATAVLKAAVLLIRISTAARICRVDSQKEVPQQQS